MIKGLYTISRELGLRAFLVGGVLRDIFLSLPIGHDYDLVLGNGSLSPANYMAELAERIAWNFQGSFFPLDLENRVYRVVIKTSSPLFPSPNPGQTMAFIDLSPIRGGDIAEDLRLRDFTMNAIALNLEGLFTGDDVDLTDPLGGQEDLEKGLVRACSEGAFIKDPIRLLRCIRLSAVCGLRIEEKTKGYIKKYACMLKDASGERIRDELFYILDLKTACPYVENLSSLGLLKQILPYPEGCRYTFPAFKDIENLLTRISDIAPSFASELTDYFCEDVGGVSKTALLKFVAMIQDMVGDLFGKDRMTTAGRMAAEAGVRLKLSKKASHFIKDTTRYLPSAFDLLTTARLADLYIYRFFKGGGRDGISPLFLSLSNIRANKGNIKEAVYRMERVLRYLFEVFYVLTSSPLLTGAEIMEIFDIQQGKVVGDIIRMVEETRARGHITDREDAVGYVRKMITS